MTDANASAAEKSIMAVFNTVIIALKRLEEKVDELQSRQKTTETKLRALPQNSGVATLKEDWGLLAAHWLKARGRDRFTSLELINGAELMQEGAQVNKLSRDELARFLRSVNFKTVTIIRNGKRTLGWRTLSKPDIVTNIVSTPYVDTDEEETEDNDLF